MNADFRTRWRNRSFRGFLSSSAGNIAVSVSLAIPGLMGAVGLASDYAFYSSKRSELQGAADSAALAAAREFSIATSSTSTISAAAKSFAAASTKSNITTTVSIDKPNSAITVELREDWTPFFAHFLGAEITPVIAKATAALVGRANLCVLTLDGSSTKTISLGTSSKISANGCGIYANSSNSEAISLAGSSVIKADLTCSVGGVANRGTITPAAMTDCPVIEDPLAGRAPPAMGACDFTDKVVSEDKVTLSPGVYCGGLELSGTSIIKFSPGTYVIKDGPFIVSGMASIAGQYVGFFLTGDNATLQFSGNSSISLSGPKDGDLAGLLIYADPATSSIQNHLIRSKNAHTLTGTIYLPRGKLRVDPGSKVGQNSAYTAIIANKLEVDKGPELVLNTDYGATDVPVPSGIKATSQVVLSD